MLSYQSLLCLQWEFLCYIIFLPLGQVPQLSCDVSMLSPLHDPPFSSWELILRTLVFVPVPQVMLHVDHDDQEAQTQFTTAKR